MSWRHVERVVEAQDTRDGAGVRLRRVIGTPALDHHDPFLLLDEFRSDDPDDYIAGFPDHPHRGFETVTYMLAGEMQHRDHLGHEGRLRAGGVQWMTAGRGIIHSEMPLQKDGLLWGFQLWVNLPAADKMKPARYQELEPEEVPEIRRHDGVVVRVVAGESAALRGAVSGIATAPLYLDVEMPRGTRFTQEVPRGHHGLCYVFEGEAGIGGEEGGEGEAVAAGRLGLLGDGEQLVVRANRGRCRFLLIAARPIAEPIARYGPFVMNTRAEIERALLAYRRGTFPD